MRPSRIRHQRLEQVAGRQKFSSRGRRRFERWAGWFRCRDGSVIEKEDALDAWNGTQNGLQSFAVGQTQALALNGNDPVLHPQGFGVPIELLLQDSGGVAQNELIVQGIRSS
jgi:hypothetical protein